MNDRETEREGEERGWWHEDEEGEEEAAPPGRDIRHLRTAADNTEDTQLGGKLGPARPPDKLPKSWKGAYD